jgi:hypothetical protein
VGVATSADEEVIVGDPLGAEAATVPALEQLVSAMAAAVTHTNHPARREPARTRLEIPTVHRSAACVIPHGFGRVKTTGQRSPYGTSRAGAAMGLRPPLRQDRFMGSSVYSQIPEKLRRRELTAKVIAVTLTWLSVIPAGLLTVAFYFIQEPPLFPEDFPGWTGPSFLDIAPWLLLFLLPPLVTGFAGRSIGGAEGRREFWRYSRVCLLVMAPFILLSAASAWE